MDIKKIIREELEWLEDTSTLGILVNRVYVFDPVVKYTSDDFKHLLDILHNEGVLIDNDIYNQSTEDGFPVMRDYCGYGFDVNSVYVRGDGHLVWSGYKPNNITITQSWENYKSMYESYNTTPFEVTDAIEFINSGRL
jgi:hypothetical protein